MNEQNYQAKMIFFSQLTNEHISDKNYEHAKNIWNEFKIKNIREYHDFYLKSDIVLLADLFENFMSLLYKSGVELGCHAENDQYQIGTDD